MDQQDRTIARRRERLAETPAAGGDEPAGSLAEQARGWGDVARQALDECQKGVAAEQEVRQRRNAPGQ